MAKKNLVKIKVGNGECFKDFLELEVFDEKTGETALLGDYLAKMLSIEANMTALKGYVDNKVLAELREFKDAERTIDDLFTKSISLLSKKIARIEKDIEDIKEA